MNLKNEIEKKANSWLIRQKEGLTSFEQKEFELWLENKHHSPNKNINICEIKGIGVCEERKRYV